VDRRPAGKKQQPNFYPVRDSKIIKEKNSIWKVVWGVEGSFLPAAALAAALLATLVATALTAVAALAWKLLAECYFYRKRICVPCWSG
jgi:hypothetical protein